MISPESNILVVLGDVVVERQVWDKKITVL